MKSTFKHTFLNGVAPREHVFLRWSEKQKLRKSKGHKVQERLHQWIRGCAWLWIFFYSTSKTTQPCFGATCLLPDICFGLFVSLLE